MTMKQKLEIWMMGSSRIVHMSRSWQRRSRQHLEMRHWILCILMLHFEWDHMTINETCLTYFCALRIWGKNSWLKHKWFWKCYFCKLWVFIYLKWWSDRPHSASFRVKATFPFYSTERISWNHHSPLISINESKRETWWDWPKFEQIANCRGAQNQKAAGDGGGQEGGESSNDEVTSKLLINQGN